MIPTMVSMVKSYVSKEYREIPLGSILAIISVLVYFVSPVDIIPDAITGVGHIDGALVILACLKLIETDIIEYKNWRKSNNKEN